MASSQTELEISAAKDNESAANDPDFAIICAFLQKFAKDLGVDIPNFNHLHKWLINTDEVSPQLRDMHIKLLRKTRKTVHEKSWESALSKFCFGYSAQDAWEIERFGYKKSSLKVKLRILKELLESQFERNNKFRTKFLTISANSLRSQPIGRDKLGHTYWLTQDDDCNLRIYQEHLDEEIWRVVATNREELVNLISRLRGNEVVMPSTDIGIVDEDTSSSNSCTVPIEKPPPPEEQDDSQEETILKIPNIRIRLGAANNKSKGDQEEHSSIITEEKATTAIDDEEKTKEKKNDKHDVDKNVDVDSKNDTEKKVKPLIISQVGSSSPNISSGSVSKKRNNDDNDSSSSLAREEFNVKRARPSLLDSKRISKPSKYLKRDEEGSSSLDDELGDEEDDDEEEEEEEDIDSAAAEEDENEEKEIEEYDDDDEFETEVSEAVQDPTVYVHGNGTGKDCSDGNDERRQENNSQWCFPAIDIIDESLCSEIIEEPIMYVIGAGNGFDCLVGNKEEKEKPPATTTTTSSEHKATFFFGEPGCLKLSPIKSNSSPTTSIKSVVKSLLEDNCKSTQKAMDEKDKKLEKNEGEKDTQQINKDVVKKTSDKVVVEKSDEASKTLQLEKSELNINQEDMQFDINGEKDMDETVTKKFKESDIDAIESKSSKMNLDVKNNTEEVLKTEYNEDPDKVDKEMKVLDEPEKLKTKTQNSSIKIELSTPSSPKPLNNENVNDGKRDELISTKLDQKSICQEITTKEKHKETIDSEKLAVPTTKIPSTTISNEKKDIPVSKSKGELSKTELEQIKSTQETTAPNRKRRLTDFQKPTPQLPSQQTPSTSESDLDPPHIDQQDEVSTKEEMTEDIGGKRFKMRPKSANSEVRKKVEAKLDANREETTSSSGEEDARRPPKTILPKKEQILKLSEQTKKSELSSKIDTLPKLFDTNTNTITSQDTIITNVIKQKQKPSLSEIIEKKLKKTPPKSEEPSPSSNSNSNSNSSSQQKQEFTPPKKSPITKPLKKNLLTQLRESDEEAVPRKRTLANADTLIHSTVVVTAAPNETVMDDFSKDKEEKQINLTEKKPEIEEITQKQIDIRNNTEESCSMKRKTPERQLLKRQNVCVEDPSPTKNEKEATLPQIISKNGDDINKIKKIREVSNEVENKLENSEDNKSERIVDKEEKKTTENATSNAKTTVVCKTTPPKIEKPVEALESSGGRRSSRRCAASVVYTELPQVKRTRAAQSKPAIKIDQANKEKNITEIKVKDEIKAEINDPLDLKTPNKIETPKLETNAEEKPNKITNIKAKKKGETKNIPKSPSVDNDNDDEEDDNIESQIKANLVPKTTATPAKTDTSSPTTVPTITTASPAAVDVPGSGPGRGRGVRKKREVDTTNIIDEDSEMPVRQSRRIAQQKIREEAERRKLEEIALRTMKQELKKKKKAEKEADPTVIEPSEHSSVSSDSEVETKKKLKKKCPGKDGWSSGSEEVEEPEEEDEYERPHYETDVGSPLFKSDHEFSPESDLEDETQVVPMKRARTARKEDADADDDEDQHGACQKCGKSDHPEWILLCDICDKGYHCSCLSPVLFYIPEGDWFCPPCQQEQLITALEKQLQEFDELVEKKRVEHEEEKRLAELAEIAAEARLKEEEEQRKERRKHKQKKRHRDDDSSKDGGSSSSSGSEIDKNHHKNIDEGSEKGGSNLNDEEDEDSVLHSSKSSKPNNKRNVDDVDKRRRGEGRNRRRRAAARGARRRRRLDKSSGSNTGSNSDGSGSTSNSESDSSSDSFSDSDDEPIYKLRKRRQINVSYRLNEYDDLINSALKKEMDEVAGAGNAGRGKDITTIIEADKEEKARLKQIEDKDNGTLENENEGESQKDDKDTKKSLNQGTDIGKTSDDQEDSDDEKPLKSTQMMKASGKKKSRKLTTLDISSEGDDGSDEDFKTSSFEDDEEDEDTSISASTDSDTSLEVFRRRNKGGKKKQRKAARRAARERRKVKKFVVEDSEDEDENVKTKSKSKSKSKKKRKDESDYTESETDDNDDLSELSENIDSADLCDDSTSEDSDGAWHPSKRKKQKKAVAGVQVERSLAKQKKVPAKKVKQLEYSDDDISETEEEEDDDDDDGVGGGKGSGKQPRSVPLIPVSSNKSNNGKGKKGKTIAAAKKKPKKKQSEDDELSFSDSGDSARRTRGRRYAYIEDYEDDSSDGGIKPGVKRPDTPPEERERFIKKQEEIKRMLAEKNAEGAKLAATPRLTPIKAVGGVNITDKDKRSPAKTSSGQDSLSTVPLSVIRQAKVLDIDYLQRKGESIGDLENPDENVDSEFDDADLPDDLPEDMDEDAIARMVEEEEEFGAATASRELPAPDEVLRTPNKNKTKDQPPTTGTTIAHSKAATNPSLEALTQMQSGGSVGGGAPTPAITIPTTSLSGLQEPTRKRLPMPTLHPPLLRHQFPHSPHTQSGNIMLHSAAAMPRHPPPTHLLQNALSAPLSQPLNRTFPMQHAHNATAPLLTRPLLSPARQIHGERTSMPSVTASMTPTVGQVEANAKPRGRRKKITPLRDPAQKQGVPGVSPLVPTANIPPIKTTSSTETHVTKVPAIVSSASVASSVIKSSAPTMPISQIPQLYKPQSNVNLGSETQTSVITRMPHMPPGRMIFPGADVARYYSSLPPPGAAGPPRQLSPNTQRLHRGPPLQMPPGLPPPPISTASYITSHTRHAPSHLNPYRPPIYGNPSYGQPRSLPTTTSSMRLGGPSTGQEYLAGPRPFPPYGYYPPPPPLTTAHLPTPPSSVIVVAPPSAIPSTASTIITPTTAISTAISVVQRPSEHSAPVDRKPTPSEEITPPPTIIKSIPEPHKKLMTLEVYTPSNAKSPLAIGGGESSGSQPDAGEDSPTSASQPQVKVGEFSGLDASELAQ